MFCAFAGLPLAVLAEGAGTLPDRPATAALSKDDGVAEEKPRNGYAMSLKPKLKRPANLQNQSYTPIKKQDDQSQVPEIEMFVGESRVFPTPGVARIAVGNGQIMTAAALDNKETIIFANAIGTSSLFVWNEDGRYQRVKVNIVPGDTTRVAREIAAFLTTIPNTKASIVGDKVIIEGDQLSDVDLDKITILEKRYPQIVNFTNRLGWEQMVMMDVKVVEFPRSELRDIGVKWTPTGGAALGGIWSPIRRGNDGPYQINIQTSPSSPSPITSAIPNPNGVTGVPLPSALNVLGAMNLGLNAQINLLAQDGKASILAEPQLSARNGAEASFLAGGEFPYSVSNINGVTIVFKPYGIKLDVTPKVDRTGVIRAKIKAEVSSIDSSVSTAGGPALLTRRTDTEFNVKSGETIVLSGLLQRDNSTDIDKVPLLGDIPVLGALFRSRRFHDKETELVIFVTPTVVDSRSPGLVDRVERATERLRQNFGPTPYLTDPLQPGQDPAKTGERQRFLIEPNRDREDDHQGTGPRPLIEPVPVVHVTDSAPRKPASSVQVLPASQNPLAASPAIRGGSTLQVTRDGLALRAEPDDKSTILLQLGYGSVVQMGAADPQPPGVGKWRNVIVGEIEGWVLSGSVAPSRLQAAIQPFRGSAIAQRDQGKNALALGADAKGSAVVAGRLQQVTPMTPLSEDASRPVVRYRVLLAEAALRVTPDVNAPVVQSLTEGQVVQALPQAPQGNWIAVQAGGKRGWAANQWLFPVASGD